MASGAIGHEQYELGSSRIPSIQRIAKAHNASPTQVALSWTTRRGVAIIPRSFSASHLADNLRASSAPCELTEAEDTALASLSARVPSRDLYGTRKVAARTP